MVQRKPTPEEQLLKLIEQSESGKAHAESSPKTEAVKKTSPANKSNNLPSFGLGKLQGFFEYLKGGLGKKNTSSPAAVLDIPHANRLLMVLVAGAALYLGIDLIFSRPDRAFLSTVSTSDAIYSAGMKNANQQSLDISVYQQALQKRNPFLSPEAQVAAEAAETGAGSAAAPAAGQGTVAEALQGVKLVGISWSEQPLAMIEDVSTGRTFFVRKGQEFNGVKVQEITQEKVNVTFEGQEGELF